MRSVPLLATLLLAGCASTAADSDGPGKESGEDTAPPPPGTIEYALDDVAYAKVTGVDENAPLMLASSVDLDGDGSVELVIGRPEANAGGEESGAVYIFDENPTGISVPVTAATATITAQPGEGAGTFGPLGDADGDGRDDLWFGASGYDSGAGMVEGRGYLFHGPIEGSHTADEAAAIFQGPGVGGPYPGGYAGWEMVLAGDTDGDGVPELMLGTYQGPAAIYFEPGTSIGLTLIADSYQTRYMGPTYNPVAQGPLGDVNGDGLADADLDGLVYLGPLPTELTPADADITLEKSGAAVWADPAGDVDADGYADLLADTNPLYVMLSPQTGTVDVETASVANIRQGGTLEGFIQEANPGDVDGDGHTDLALGQGDGTDPGGMAWIAFGPFVGSITLYGGPSVLLVGDEEDDAGSSVMALGDLTGDGLPDVGVAGLFDSDGGRHAGAIWVVEGTMPRP